MPQLTSLIHNTFGWMSNMKSYRFVHQSSVTPINKRVVTSTAPFIYWKQLYCEVLVPPGAVVVVLYLYWVYIF